MDANGRKKCERGDEKHSRHSWAPAIPQQFHRQSDRYFISGIRFFCALISVVASTWTATIQAESAELENSHQCLLVLTNDWSSSHGRLQAFQRTDQGDWKRSGSKFSVVLGKHGLGHGPGLVPIRAVPNKIEGDDRAPAGIFALASAFGNASSRSADWIKLPYSPLSKDTEGIDDPKSRYYNKLVDRSKVKQVDWQSSEQMRRNDVLYRWGIMVSYNPANVPGLGSCIFMHIWKNSSTATSGCTAMAEPNLVRLLHWLDPGEHPILVQMPRMTYESIRAKYQLPNGSLPD
jgi:D-alanyl-D-alanine dipeptidase